MNVDTATITNRLRKNNIKIVNHRKYQIEEDFSKMNIDEWNEWRKK